MGSSNRWVDGDLYYRSSSSPSTESDSFSENTKSVDTVSKLFSSLLKSSNCSLHTDSKSPTSTDILPNDLQTVDTEQCASKNWEDKQECAHEPLLSKDQHCLNVELNVTQSEVPSSPVVADEKTVYSLKRSLAASSETVVIDRLKDHSTPSNSRIPVLHLKSDPLDYYTSLKKPQISGLKYVNVCSLKRICSNSKIPVAKNRLNQNTRYENFAASGHNFSNQRVHRDKTAQKKNEKYATGKYTHVKSKLAPYINRPMKTDCTKSTRLKSPSEKKPKNETCFPYFSGIKRISSRTSLETYTCDYKLPFLEINCSDCGKSEDAAKNQQKACEHFELAMEHSRMKMENKRIIDEHRRIIEKHRDLVLEHEEKANEHTLKAIFHVLNRIT